MNPGAFIAIAVAAVIVALVGYGLSHDLRAWWEERCWREDKEHAIQVLKRADANALARQLEAIRNLPEIEPRRWVG